MERCGQQKFLTNSMIGPALGSFLIGLAISLPFLADGVTFLLSGNIDWLNQDEASSRD